MGLTMNESAIGVHKLTIRMEKSRLIHFSFSLEVDSASPINLEYSFFWNKERGFEDNSQIFSILRGRPDRGRVEFEVVHNFRALPDTSLCSKDHLLAIWIDGKVFKVASFTLDAPGE